MIDQALGQRLIELRARVIANFDAGNWEELGLLTGHSDTINRHPRLLRSLSWGDEDYDGNVLTVLRRIVESDPRTLPIDWPPDPLCDRTLVSAGTTSS